MIKKQAKRRKTAAGGQSRSTGWHGRVAVASKVAWWARASPSAPERCFVLAAYYL